MGRHLFVFFALTITMLCSIAGKPIDSLQQLVKSNPQRALTLLQNQNLKHDTTVKDFILLTKAYENIGRFYTVDSLLEYAFARYNFKKDSASYIELLRMEARNKKVLDMFEESLTDLNFALDYVKRKGDKLQLIDVYLQFAEYYRAVDNYEMACSYLDKVNEIGLQVPGGFPPLLKARMMNRKAAVFMEKAVFLDSVEYLSKAVIQLATRYNELDLLASSSNELGYLYLNTQNLNAEFWFKKAITIWDHLGYYNYAYSARINLARLYLKKKEPQKAINLSKTSIKVVKQFGWMWDQGYWNEILALAYEQQHNYPKAFTYLKEAKEALLRTSRTEYIERLAFYSNKLELRSKEHELRKKNIEVEKAHLEISNKSLENRFLFTMLLVAIFVLIGSIVFLLISRRQQKKIHDINKQLQNLLTQKEVLLQEINHRVKNNLSLLSGLMYLKEHELKDEAAIRAIREMHGRINTIGLIHETLYQRDDVEHINFQQYLEKLSAQIMLLNPEQRNVAVTISCADFNPELAVAMPLSMMMNELITNSVKHAFTLIKQPEIEIMYYPNEQVLTYADNGPGHDPEVPAHSFGKKLLGIFATQIHAKIIYERDRDKLVTKIILNNKNKRP